MDRGVGKLEGGKSIMWRLTNEELSTDVCTHDRKFDAVGFQVRIQL